MKIVVLTPEFDKANETYIVNQLFEKGLERLHLRKAKFSLKDYRNYLKEIAPEYRSRVVLHGGGFELFYEMNAGGVHLSGALRSNADIYNKISYIPIEKISTSMHSWNEIYHDNRHYGYVFISPVFDSISKTSYKASVDLIGLSKLRKQLEQDGRYCPEIYALGGIDIPHIDIVKKFHFDGIVIYGAIWKSSDPLDAYKAIEELANRNL